ncbi:hypothetical protein D3C81_1196670 [compost metagenome]
MHNQRAQFERKGIGQRLHRSLGKHFAAEGPAQGQLTAIDLTIDRQPVGQLRRTADFRTAGLSGRTQQGIAVSIETGVELPQVVEGNAPLRHTLQGRLLLGVTEVAQHAIAQAFVRQRA